MFLSTELLREIDEFENGEWRPNEFSKMTHFKVVSATDLLPLNEYLITRVVISDVSYIVSNVHDEWTRLAIETPYSDHLLF